MIIDPKSLSEEALIGVLEEFIGRDGTDYGEVELSLEQKIARLKPQLKSGAVLIVFDQASEQVNLIAKDDYDGCS